MPNAFDPLPGRRNQGGYGQRRGGGRAQPAQPTPPAQSGQGAPPSDTNASSTFSGNTLRSHVQAAPGYAPSGMEDWAKYVRLFQPPPAQQQYGNAGMQYRGLQEPRSRLDEVVRPQQQPAPEEWVDVPAQRRLTMGGPSGTVRVRRDSQAAQQAGLGVVGY